MSKTNYTILLEDKIKEIVMIMRQMFKNIDNNIYNQLTEEYEEELLGLCRLIPSDWSKGVYASFSVAMDVIDSVDWSKIATTIDKHPEARIWFDIDVEQTFRNFLIERTHYSNKIKASVLKICQKFKPIFDGLNIMIKNPTPLLHRITILRETTQEHADILNKIM